MQVLYLLFHPCPGGAAGSLSPVVQMPTLKLKDGKLIQMVLRPCNQTPEPSPETPHKDVAVPSPGETVLILSSHHPENSTQAQRPHSFVHLIHILFVPQLPQPLPTTTINDLPPSMNSNNSETPASQVNDHRAQAQIRNVGSRPGGNSDGPESQSTSRAHLHASASLGPSVCGPSRSCSPSRSAGPSRQLFPIFKNSQKLKFYTHFAKLSNSLQDKSPSVGQRGPKMAIPSSLEWKTRKVPRGLLCGPVVRSQRSRCREPASAPDQGTRSHLPQLRPGANK